MPPISNFSSNAKLVTANPVYPYGRCIVARPPEGVLHKVSHHAWWPSRRSALDIFLGYMESKALFSRTLSMLSCMSTPAHCSTWPILSWGASKFFFFTFIFLLFLTKKCLTVLSITCDQLVFYSFYDQTKFRSFASLFTSLPLHVTLWLYPICRIVLIFIPGFIPNFIFRVHFRDPINSVSIYPAASQVNEQCQMNIGHFLVPTDLI